MNESTALVVTTYNRPQALARSLPQLLALGLPLLIVEDGTSPTYEEAYNLIFSQYPHPHFST